MKAQRTKIVSSRVTLIEYGDICKRAGFKNMSVSEYVKHKLLDSKFDAITDYDLQKKYIELRDILLSDECFKRNKDKIDFIFFGSKEEKNKMKKYSEGGLLDMSTYRKR